MIQFRLEIALECDGIAVLGVARAKHKRDVATAHSFDERLPDIGTAVQFRKVTASSPCAMTSEMPAGWSGKFHLFDPPRSRPRSANQIVPSTPNANAVSRFHRGLACQRNAPLSAANDTTTSRTR
jgi:hypothetical protein